MSVERVECLKIHISFHTLLRECKKKKFVVVVHIRFDLSLSLSLYIYLSIYAKSYCFATIMLSRFGV